MKRFELRLAPAVGGLRPWLLLATFPLMAGPLAAQMATAVTTAAATITERDVAHRIGLLAHDSMGGRDTPSRGLELTARYVAAQFKAFGLKPGGDQGTWLQWYPLPRQRTLDFTQSSVVFAAGGREAAADFTSAARLSRPFLPAEPVSGGAVLVAGRHSAASVQGADLRDKIVLYVAPEGIDQALQQQVLAELFRASRGVVILSPMDSATFAARQQAALQRATVTTGPHWAVVVWPGAVQDVLTAGGLDLVRARAETEPVVRALPPLTVRLEAVAAAGRAPNAVGILEGRDPVLKHEYLVFSAHMDHVGLKPGQADSVYNGADDNASGTAGILELAEAFSRPGARPRRSVIFLTVSGEEKGLWGSDYFVAHPPVPLKQMVADINLDMIGRNWADTVVVIGQEHSDLGATLQRVVVAHPELRMQAVGDLWPEEQFYFRSDHYNFARRGVPILFFFSGAHPDYHQVTDAPEKINAEKEARILRLVFHLGQAVGNADQRPKWHEASYQKIVQQP